MKSTYLFVIIFFNIQALFAINEKSNFPEFSTGQLYDIAFLEQKIEPKIYTKVVRFKIPKFEIEKIVYGNGKFGFLEAMNFILTKDNYIEINLLPPYYSDTINFYGFSGKKKIKLGESLFEEPQHIFKKIVSTQIIKGKFSTPFFSVPISITYEGKIKNHFNWGIMIFNKWGQIVWAYYDPQRPYFLMEKFSGKDFFLKGIYNDLILSHDGKKKLFTHVPYSHHDCQKKSTNIIYCLSETKRYIKQSLLNEGREVIGFNVIEYNTKTKKMYEKWNVFDNAPKILKLAEQKYKSNIYEKDWFHANSLQIFDTNKLIISLKYLNKVIVLDLNSKKVIRIWGESTQETNKTKHTTNLFHNQHHATMIDKKFLTVADNGVEKSSIKKFSLTENLNLKTEWTFTPSPHIYSHAHGSVYKSLDNRLMCYLLDRKSFTHHFFELDIDTGQKKAHLITVANNFLPHTKSENFAFFMYRSAPFFHLNNDPFIGFKLENKI